MNSGVYNFLIGVQFFVSLPESLPVFCGTRDIFLGRCRRRSVLINPRIVSLGIAGVAFLGFRIFFVWRRLDVFGRRFLRLARRRLRIRSRRRFVATVAVAVAVLAQVVAEHYVRSVLCQAWLLCGVLAACFVNLLSIFVQ